MAGQEQHARFALEDGLGAVAVVDVEVGDRHPLQAVHGQRLGRAHGQVVEQAKPHRLIAGGMVARRTHCAERSLALPADHRIDRRRHGAGGAQCRLDRAGPDPGVFIQCMQLAVAGMGQDAVDVSGAVHAQQLFAAGARRLDAVECREAVVIQRLQHGAQAGRAFGVIEAASVLQTIGVGVEPHHPAVYSAAGLGFRRRSCCHSTSP